MRIKDKLLETRNFIANGTNWNMKLKKVITYNIPIQ